MSSKTPFRPKFNYFFNLSFILIIWPFRQSYPFPTELFEFTFKSEWLAFYFGRFILGWNGAHVLNCEVTGMRRPLDAPTHSNIWRPWVVAVFNVQNVTRFSKDEWKNWNNRLNSKFSKTSKWRIRRGKKNNLNKQNLWMRMFCDWLKKVGKPKDL